LLREQEAAISVPMPRILDVSTSLLASGLRAGSGMQVGALGARPEQVLELYEFENCPFCRKVREAFSILDLDADIRPCPKAGPRFRPELERRGGKAQFPYLVDPNADIEMYESQDIVGYLFERYGQGGVPLLLATPLLRDVTSILAGLSRAGRGSHYRPARIAERPLELYSFEASPFCRLVREVLCTLELPYRLHNVARGSRSREAFVQRSGRMRVPYLIDPNTGSEMFESADIVRYLEQTYAE
jgi:glutathione S-transferase